MHKIIFVVTLFPVFAFGQSYNILFVARAFQGMSSAVADTAGTKISGNKSKHAKK